MRRCVCQGVRWFRRKSSRTRGHGRRPGTDKSYFISAPRGSRDRRMSVAMSAGETPEMRLAWPRLAGRMSLSFCRASSRSGTCPVVEILRQQPLLEPGELRHLPQLALDVARVLEPDLRLLGHDVRQLRPRGIEGRKVGIGDLRPAQEIGKTHARARRRGSARGEHRGERGGRREVRLLQPGALGVYQPVFFLHGGKTCIRHQPDAVSDGAQALVGVILPVQQAVFRAGGHDAVRLVRCCVL